MSRPATLLLDRLSDEQIAELQGIAEREDESITVSDRLGQMMAKVAKSNDHIKEAMQSAFNSSQEKFAAMLATPLHEMSSDYLDIDDDFD